MEKGDILIISFYFSFNFSYALFKEKKIKNIFFLKNQKIYIDNVYILQ